MIQTNRPKFPLGQVLATPGALLSLERAGDTLQNFLQHHQSGDWGETCAEDAQMNEDALCHGGRLFSVYYLRSAAKLWIITEADRSSTTALLPSEY